MSTVRAKEYRTLREQALAAAKVAHTGAQSTRQKRAARLAAEYLAIAERMMPK